ncbi:MAG: YmfQ family protein [Oscillospiraceae bacterium]|jgi:hypothetical protein|nr:YmfQ family protein [Oscillospiraceae bacterium]
MYYNNGYDTTAEELRTFYPAFYYGVREMEALWAVNGGLLDEVIVNIDQTIKNAFFLSMNLKMVQRMEAFFGIPLDAAKSLQERRIVLLSLALGAGKLSAAKIRRTIALLTGGANSTVAFQPLDETDNNYLVVTIYHSETQAPPMDSIDLVLSKTIPAHLPLTLSQQFENSGHVYVGAYYKQGVSVTIQPQET